MIFVAEVSTWHLVVTLVILLLSLHPQIVSSCDQRLAQMEVYPRKAEGFGQYLPRRFVFKVAAALRVKTTKDFAVSTTLLSRFTGIHQSFSPLGYNFRETCKICIQVGLTSSEPNPTRIERAPTKESKEP